MPHSRYKTSTLVKSQHTVMVGYVRPTKTTFSIYPPALFTAAVFLFTDKGGGPDFAALAAANKAEALCSGGLY